MYIINLHLFRELRHGYLHQRSGFVLAQIFRLEMLASIHLFVAALRQALISVVSSFLN